ncbi:MAG TPA: hypothetical protein VH593_12175 [Ktedonobacteraceae bacterium]|jgi:hypothetical protein
MKTQVNPRGSYPIRSSDAWQESTYTQYRVPARPGKIATRPAAPTPFYPPPLRFTNPPVEITIKPTRPFAAQHWLTDFTAPAQYHLRPSPSLNTPIYLDADLPDPFFLRWFFAPIINFFNPFKSSQQVSYAKKHAYR